MTTATGAYVIDWSGLPDTNPYTETGWETNAGNVKIETGILRPATGGIVIFAHTATSGTGLLQTRAEIPFDSAAPGDPSTVGVFDPSTWNGYIFGNWTGRHRISRVDAGVVTPLTSVDPTYSAGAVFELRYDTATGALEALIDGVSLLTYTDTTHSGIALSGGVLLNDNNVNNGGAMSYGADGFSGAADTTPPTLSNPTLTVDSNTAVTFGATSDEDGTAHAVVRLASDPAATQQEIVDGTYANAVAVPADVAVTANTAYQFAQVTGLTGNTQYAVDQVATDAAGNISAINTQTFTTQSKALRLTIDGGANRTYDFDVFSTTVDGTATIIKQFDGVTVAADGTVTLGLDDTSVTSGTSLEGIGKDTTTGDPVPIQGTVTVA